MARTLTKHEIFELSVEERLRLIETVWDSIDPAKLPVPEGHREALDEALEDYRRDPDNGETWDAVREELFPRQ
jgi:putative addiction module component (TIGR02574 family)